jgi:hypothetical protein
VKQEGLPPTGILLITRKQSFTEESHETKKETKKIEKIAHGLLAIEK